MHKNDRFKYFLKMSRQIVARSRPVLHTNGASIIDLVKWKESVFV